MNFDFTITISIVIAVIALVSPIITAAINNAHESKIKKLDMCETAKRKALSDFVDAAEAVVFNFNTDELMLKYTSAASKLFIYFSTFSLEALSSFEDARAMVSKEYSVENFQKANNELSLLISKLSKEIKKK